MFFISLKMIKHILEHVFISCQFLRSQEKIKVSTPPPFQSQIFQIASMQANRALEG